MKTTKYALVAALGLIALVAPRAIWADTILQFNASGRFEDGSVLTGTLTVDTTTGVPTGESLEVTGPTTLTDIPFLGYSEDQPQFFMVQAYGFNNDSVVLFFDVPNLIGYTGGAICGLSTGCVSTISGPLGGPVISYATDPVHLTAGSLTIPASVPEPSSMVLLGTGLIGTVGASRQRLRKAFATAYWAWVG